MMNASLSLILLLWAFPWQCHAQTETAIISPNDLAVMRILLEEISADPDNPKVRFLLRRLWQEKLESHYQDVKRKREEALEQGLKVSGKLGVSTETQTQLTQALEALNPISKRIAQNEGQRSGGATPKADMFIALLRVADGYYEQGRAKEGFLVLTTALNLYSAPPRALPLSGKPPKAEPAQKAKPAQNIPAFATQTSAPTPIEGATSYRLVSPEEEESAWQHFRAGIRFYGSGKLAEAAQSFREGLAHDPNNEWNKKSLERTIDELKLKAGNAPSKQPPALPASGPIRYLTQKEDTLWDLAQRFYGDPLQWKVIRDANPQLKGRSKVTSGASLIIPPLPKTSKRN